MNIKKWEAWSSHIFSLYLYIRAAIGMTYYFLMQRSIIMFKLEGKLTFININQDYLRMLHQACPEVYYKPCGYDNKPYIGIMIHSNTRKYVIPLSSAKEKHKAWKNVNKDCFLIYETAKK